MVGRRGCKTQAADGERGVSVLCIKSVSPFIYMTM